METRCDHVSSYCFTGMVGGRGIRVKILLASGTLSIFIEQRTICISDIHAGVVPLGVGFSAVAEVTDFARSR